MMSQKILFTTDQSPETLARAAVAIHIFRNITINLTILSLSEWKQGGMNRHEIVNPIIKETQEKVKPGYDLLKRNKLERDHDLIISDIINRLNATLLMIAKKDIQSRISQADFYRRIIHLANVRTLLLQ